MTEHYVDWAKIPEEFKWVATDANGSTYAFGARPQRRVDGWYEGGPYSLIERPAD